QRYQRKLDDLIREGEPLQEPYDHYAPSYSKNVGCLYLPEYWAGLFFVLGALMLTTFAVVNLLS
ncbi:MAG TPA: hypothetical protein VGJ69_09485, partial [Pyrinomonadaceae bacterium]